MPYTTYEFWPDDTGYVKEVSWDNGAKTSEQLIPVGGAPPAEVANFASLISKAQTALSNNQTFLGIASPTNAEAISQVQALTRQMDAVIYYLLQALTGLSTVPGT